MAQRHQQVAHRARPQERQRALGNVGERDVRVLQLEPLHDAAHRQRHHEQQHARRSDPEMRTHEPRERKLQSHQLRHDAINRPKHHHREEPVAVQQAHGGGEPGELGDLPDLRQRADRLIKPAMRKAPTPKPINRNEGLASSRDHRPARVSVHVHSHGNDRDEAQHCGHPARRWHPRRYGRSRRYAAPTPEENQHPERQQRQVAAVQFPAGELGHEIENRTQTDQPQPDHQQIVGIPPGNHRLRHPPRAEVEQHQVAVE